MDIQLLFAPKVTGARFILRNVCAAEGYIPETEEEEEEEEETEGSSQDKKDDNSDEDDVDERELSWKRFPSNRIPAKVPACLGSTAASASWCLY